MGEDLEAEKRGAAAAAAANRVACIREVLGLSLEAPLSRRSVLEPLTAPVPKPFAKLVNKALRVYGRQDRL